MKMENELQTIDMKPQEVANFAADAAKVLKDIVTKAKTSVVINGHEYLQFEAWQTIAKFYNTTVTVQYTKPMIDLDNNVVGYEARANVIDKTGRIIASAESSCSRDEDTWKDRADFQVRSMSQTRACAKALRQVFAWVVVLSGYSGTPSEEMEDISTTKPINATVTEVQSVKCADCGKEINDNVSKFSVDRYKKPLCMFCQKNYKPEVKKLKGEVTQKVDE